MRFFQEKKAPLTLSLQINSHFFNTFLSKLRQMLDLNITNLIKGVNVSLQLSPSTFLISLFSRYINKKMLSIITEKTKKVLISSKFRNLIFILFIIFLSVGLFEALILSPQDYLQSDSVRIMYVHVPSAWISLGIFSMIAFLSLGVIIFKNKNFVLISKSFQDNKYKK